MEPVLIATNSSMTDVCAIDSFELDMVIGHDAQDFTARFAPVANVGGGSLLYIDGTEYGGIVDEVTTDTESDAITCHGRTWDGILACKRIMPPSGSAYRTVSGEANALLASLVTLLDIGDVFAASTDDSGITVSSYQFGRFVDGYGGIAQMLDSAGAKLVMRRLNGKTVMSAEAKLTIGDEADSDLMDFSVTKTRRCVNHLVCAGEGDLQDRVVIDLYADADGNVSTTQTFTGRDEITAFYDYNNADAAELLAEGTKKLQEYFTKGAVDISRIGRGEWHVGDVLAARDNQSGVMVSTSIAGKTVQVDKSTDWQLRVGYVVGEAERMNPSSNGTAEQPEKVNRDGDTMTGGLTVDAERVYLKSTNLDRDGAAPSSQTIGNAALNFHDKDDEKIGQLMPYANTNGAQVVGLYAYNEDANGNQVQTQLNLYANKDGTHSYYVNDTEAFCAALHVGDYVGKDQTANVSMANNGYTNVCSINVTAGTWVVYANIAWASNATGRRHAYISTSSQSSTSVRAASCNAVNGGMTYQNVAGVTDVGSATTFYLVGWQNSGAALNATGYLRAVRIK